MARSLWFALALLPVVAGCLAKSSSPLKLADAEATLKKRMNVDEFDSFVAKSDERAKGRTTIFSHALIEGDPPKANLNKEVRTYNLADGKLVVIIEFVGPKEEPEARVVSWRTELAR